MKIERDFKNELLKRREIMAVFVDEKTPSIEKVCEELSNEFNIGKEVIVVKSIRGGFGKKEFKVDVFIYSDAEQKNMIEPKGIVKENKVKLGEEKK